MLAHEKLCGYACAAAVVVSLILSSRLSLVCLVASRTS